VFLEGDGGWALGSLCNLGLGFRGGPTFSYWESGNGNVWLGLHWIISLALLRGKVSLLGKVLLFFTGTDLFTLLLFLVTNVRLFLRTVFGAGCLGGFLGMGGMFLNLLVFRGCVSLEAQALFLGEGACGSTEAGTCSCSQKMSGDTGSSSSPRVNSAVMLSSKSLKLSLFIIVL
jgi:hypothetical protein